MGEESRCAKYDTLDPQFKEHARIGGNELHAATDHIQHRIHDYLSSFFDFSISASIRFTSALDSFVSDASKRAWKAFCRDPLKKVFNSRLVAETEARRGDCVGK